MIHSAGCDRMKAELEVERGNVGYLAEAGEGRGRWTVARAHRILALSISLAPEPLSHRISCSLRNARRLVPLPNCLLSLPRHFHFPCFVFQEPYQSSLLSLSLSLELPPTFVFLKTFAHRESVMQPIECIPFRSNYSKGYTGNRRGIINYRLDG